MSRFPLEEIPQVMRNYGWRHGQRLMETWFSRPAAAAPHYGRPVTNVVTMGWVLSFERARKVYNKLKAEQIWINDAAQKAITMMLDRKGFLTGFPGTQPFGDLTRPVPDLDSEYINYRAGGDSEHLDPLGGALGMFSLRVVVAGTVTKTPAPENDPFLVAEEQPRPPIGHDVTIEEVGVYVRDSYDFEGDQFLGFWAYPGQQFRDSSYRMRSFPSGKTAALPFEGGELVTNYDFRRWRERTGKGGDFLVFSDLMRLPVHGPNTFNTSTYENGTILRPVRDRLKR